MLKIYAARTSRERESACAHALLAFAWRALFTQPTPPLCKEAGGRPYFAGNPVFFSLSHSGGVACAAISDGRVGVDLECIRPIRPALVQRVLAPSEQRQLADAVPQGVCFFHFWTLKEAYLKFTGEGLRSDMEALCFDLSGRTPKLKGSALCFQTLHMDGGIVLSVCTERAEHAELTELSLDALDL